MDDGDNNSASVDSEIVNVISGGYQWEFFSPGISPVYHEQYSCCICYLVLREPYKCTNNHLYCKSCLHNWIISDNACSIECPVCRDPGPFLEDSKIMSELDNHSVICLIPQCTWEGILSAYLTHCHGEIEAYGRQVPDLTKTLIRERHKKERGDGFINEDRIVTMMSVIYADIENRRRRIENIRLGRNDYTNDQLGDIQLLHDRLLSLRHNIDTFFGQTDSSPLWTRITDLTTRPTARPTPNSTSTVSSSPPSEMSDQVELMHISPESVDGGEQTESFDNNSPVLSFSSEFDLSDDNSDIQLPTNEFDYNFEDVGSIGAAEEPEVETIVEEATPVVQTNLPHCTSAISEPVIEAVERNLSASHTNVPSRDLHTNSTATSRLRYNYLSRRFNFDRRLSDPADIKRRKFY